MDIVDIQTLVKRDGYCIFKSNFESNAQLENFFSSMGVLSSENNYKSVVADILVADMLNEQRYLHKQSKMPMHTDSAGMIKPHDYVVLHCIKEDANGSGCSLLCFIDDIWDKLNDDSKHLEELLSTNFLFKARNRDSQGPIFKSILSFSDKNELNISYRRDIISYGESQKWIFDKLDKIINEHTKSFKLQGGDTLIINNLKVLHGRSEITDRENSGRHLKRVRIFSEQR